MTMRSCHFLLVGVMLFGLVISHIAAHTVYAQSTLSITVDRELSLPGASVVKFPQLAIDQAGTSRTVHISGVDGVSRTTAGMVKLWAAPDTALSFPEPLVMGTVGAGAAPDYVVSAVATAPTGEVYVAWVDQAAKTIRLRRREPNGAWHPATFEVMRGHRFATELAIVVRTTGQVIIAWRDGPPIQYTSSTDRGATWAAVQSIQEVSAYRSPTSLAAGPNGEVAIAFTRDTPRPLHVMIALWNGTAFGPPIDVNGDSTSLTFADPTVTFSPHRGTETRIAVAYRGVSIPGVYVDERPVSAVTQPWSFPLRPLVYGSTDGRVTALYDQYGSLHLAWIRQASSGGRNRNQLFTTMRPSSQSTFLPLVGSPTVGLVFNAWADVQSSPEPMLHVVHEFFVGDNIHPRYVRFRAPGFGSRPLINMGAAVVGGSGQTTVQVTFPDLTTNALALPNQVRWRWGAPPTDTEHDSGGWQPFTPTGPTSTLTVPIPPALRTDAGCVERVLYTQLRSTTSGITDIARTDSIVVDLGVAASVVVANPFSQVRHALLPIPSTNGRASDGKATDGDTRYTRVPQVFLHAVDTGDCGGVQSIAVSGSRTTIGTASRQPFTLGRYTVVQNAPTDPSNETTIPIVVDLEDRYGNRMLTEHQLIYDTTAPVVQSGSLSILPRPGQASILVDLRFTNLSVTDDRYPRGAWGVWIANSRTPVANPAADPSLTWTPVAITGTDTTFSVLWSLATGIPSAQRTPGTYYVYVRVLDGAGNPSDAVLTASTTLGVITMPRVYIPLITRMTTP